jgi:undecaprenyl diphosphate synthase
MQMYIDYLRKERATMMENNIRFRQIGRLEHLPDEVLAEMEITLEQTRRNDGLTLTLALNYSSRAEITDAVRAIAEQVKIGRLQPPDIDEATISSHLYTAAMPDPDLLIRTAGEMRISNYLLWQISYAELFVSPVLWPDFSPDNLHEAIVSFAGRNRRFGALDHSNTPARPSK